MIRVLVADDHPVVREGLVMMLETQSDFEVIGSVENGQEVLNLCKDQLPDVLLLDLEMPEMDGLETLTTIREEYPDVRVLVFTAFDTDDRIVQAVQAGAKGYLLKGTPRDDLFRAIRVVNQGGSILEPVVASKLMQHIAEPTPEKLTAREMEVLVLVAQGLLNKEVAVELKISERTVKFHMSAILGKLSAGNRTEAVSIAVQKGIITIE